MGRVRVPGLSFSLEYLRAECEKFHELIQEDSWLGEDQHREGVSTGLTFIMLNLSDAVDRDEAWEVYHKIMDEYHDRCDRLHLIY